MSYLGNAIISIFLIFDSIKHSRNKFSIPILGLCLPYIGISVLLVSTYVSQNTSNNG